MCSFKLIFFIIFLLNAHLSRSLISDQRLCINKDCSEPISLAKTLLRYSSPEPHILSFSPNQQIKIFSKEAGTRNDLWGAEINGKRGYIPKKLVREFKILGKPTVVVTTEPVQTQKVPTKTEKNVEPDKVRQPFEVVDGTTIYLDPNPISPSSTESPILATASPIVNQDSKQRETTTEENDTEISSAESNKITEASDKKGVIEDVFSSIKNWINDDKSGEDEEDDEEGDEEDDEEDDEEIESVEEAEDKTDAKPESLVNQEYSEKVQDETKKKSQEGIEEQKKEEKSEDSSTKEQTKNPYEIKVKKTEADNLSREESQTPQIVAEEENSRKEQLSVADENEDQDGHKYPENEVVNATSQQPNVLGKTEAEHGLKNPEKEVVDAVNQQSNLLGKTEAEHGLKNHEKEVVDAGFQQPILLGKTEAERRLKIPEKEVVEAASQQPSDLEKTEAEHGLKNHEKEFVDSGIQQPSVLGIIEAEHGLKNHEKGVVDAGFQQPILLGKTEAEHGLKIPEKEVVEAASQQPSDLEKTEAEHGLKNHEKEFVDSGFQQPSVLGIIEAEHGLKNSEEEVADAINQHGAGEIGKTEAEHELKNSEKEVDGTSQLNVPQKTEVEDGNKSPEMEAVDATTQLTIDIEDALPIVSTEEVTPNPVESKSHGSIFSPLTNSFFDKKVDPPKELEEKSLEHNSSNLEETKVEENLKEDPKSEEMTFEHPLNVFSSHGNANVNFDMNTKENVELDKPDENNLPTELEKDPQSSIFENNEEKNDLPLDNIIETLQNNGIPVDEIFGNNFKGDDAGKSELIEEKILKEESGIFSGIFSLFGGSESKVSETVEVPPTPISNEREIIEELLGKSRSVEENVNEDYCTNSKDNCDTYSKVENDTVDKLALLMNTDILLYLGTTAVACLMFLFVYMLVDKSSREAPLVEKINKLEKELMVTLKEKQELQEGSSTVDEISGNMSTISSDELYTSKKKLQEAEINLQTLEMRILSLQKEVEDKEALEDQIETLEKELETSTEVGMELNRLISEILDPTNGGEKLKENVEQLQRQLLEQKGIISDISRALNEKETENADLLDELSASRRKTNELQGKLDGILGQILKIEKERDQQVKSLQEEIELYQQKFSEEAVKKEILNSEIQVLKSQLLDAQRKAEMKIKEYQILKDSLNGIKSVKNDKETLRSLLDATSLKAELEQLKIENDRYAAHLKQEEAVIISFEKKCQTVMEQNEALVKKYQESDKEKVESTMKLEVLNNYFKKREEELQSEILKYKSIWDAKEGEATSSTERIKLMAEEIENYKSQNETLKQEILSQEIDLKSQISMLEKKVHENWVTSRQMERKLEDARHESAQLRNRLTLRERAIIDERTQNRLQSPLDQNGELTLSPPPIESPTSPQILFGGRDHITKSPPLPGLPPFLPPPPGAPFMPPPIPGIPFMPPPPVMFPGDHRPPPLGRMSSPPPLNSRYSPDTSAFSPYDRTSPSPPYDSEYGASPPPMRGYSPYSRDDRRDYKRPVHASNGRNNKGSLISSESDHSNDSLGKGNRKMV